jgi:TonB family protein
MTNPFVSFLVAFLVWIFLLVVFSWKFFTKSEIPPVSLTIDATMLDEVEQEKKSIKNFAAEKNGQQKITEKPQAQKTQNSAQKKVAPLFNPLPKIPDDLRDEAFRSEVLARFQVAVNGEVVNVELIKPCSNPRLNSLLLKSLKTWKFQPSSAGFSQEIKVTFAVE